MSISSDDGFPTSESSASSCDVDLGVDAEELKYHSPLGRSNAAKTAPQHEAPRPLKDKSDGEIISYSCI